ncbi:MAG: hypothetical protein ACTSW1_14070 [Candidatus Hodarchaeales archaeon]
MYLDPFFSDKSEGEKHADMDLTNSSNLSMFLCLFDVVQGLQVFFSVPDKLKEDKDEINILKTHCIWKIDKIPMRIDLKFSNYTYAAYLLNINPENGGKSGTNDIIYGLVIKLPKKVNVSENTLMIELKSVIEEKLGPQIMLLHMKNKLKSNPLKRKEYKELKAKTRPVEELLKKHWNFFVTQYQILNQATKNKEEDKEKQTNNTPLKKPGLFKPKIKMRVYHDQEPDKILVILGNDGKDITDVLIHVSKRTEFFSETIWEQKLAVWPSKEDIILEFHKSDQKQNFLIKISSKKNTLTIKSLDIP